MPVEDFIIYVYCCVDEALHEVVKTPLRKRGFAPKLSDGEVITMELVGEFMGEDQDKGIWRYFRTHWHDWFPNLGSRSTFVKQSAALYDVKRRVHHHLVVKMGAVGDSIHMVDGFPMPVCEKARAAHSKCFKGEADYSYCASKRQYYYGFEGYIVINFDGVICDYTFAAANIDERDVLQDMTDEMHGLLIGDKGFIRPLLKEELAQQRIDLQTPLRKNMKDKRPKTFVHQLMKTRRLVETVISQLTERFHIEKVRARDCFHLSNRFIRKILAHTLGTFLNRILGHPILHFDDLVLT
jgi:hypothetical protein